MGILWWVIASTFIISLLAFAGMIVLALKEKLLNKILLILVALSAGALLGGAFIHLLPEALEGNSAQAVFGYTLVGFVVFFFIEKVLHWRHCHKGKCPIHTVKSFGYMNLIGDGIHNFTDGLIIAAAFFSNFGLGIVTTLAVALHEVPQEIGDFGVLLYAGFKKKKAIILNYAVAATVLLGGVVGYLLSAKVEAATSFLIPLAAASFIYIASADLVPLIRGEENFWRSVLAFLVFLIGITLMYGIKFLG